LAEVRRFVRIAALSAAFFLWLAGTSVALMAPATPAPRAAYGYDTAAAATTPSSMWRTAARFATTVSAGGPRLATPPHSPRRAAKAGDDASSTVRHYTTSERARQIEKSGEIRPGASGKAYFTPDRYSSATDAQRGLALPTKPEGYFEVPLSRLRSPSPMRRVDPNFGQPGGGLECRVTCPTDVSGLRFRRVRP